MTNSNFSAVWDPDRARNSSAINRLINLSAGTIIEAGSDTTRNQINIMLAGAARYPDWVHKAREELDRVLGDAKRLPNFDVSVESRTCPRKLKSLYRIGNLYHTYSQL